MDLTRHNQNPAITSLDSVNGPSVIVRFFPENLTRTPLGVKPFAREHDACLYQFFVKLSHFREHFLAGQNARSAASPGQPNPRSTFTSNEITPYRQTKIFLCVGLSLVNALTYPNSWWCLLTLVTAARDSFRLVPAAYRCPETE
jgi:hypothetical protein